MRAVRLKTTNLELAPTTPAQMQAAINAMDQYQRAQPSADWLARFRAATTSDPWVHGFSAVLRESGVSVGTGGFKGPPIDAAVEIAYGVDVDHQNKGYGTEIATALVTYALTFAEVDVVRAHTLPDSMASQRILAKCGFERVGEWVDPEDGLVWRFEKQRVASNGRS
jgi:RimJ/RimL family protein N-acetyltransferase